MAYSFHIPFWLPPDQRLSWNEKVLDLVFSADEHVFVQADIVDEMTHADRLSLRGEGYATTNAAATAGSEWVG